MGKENVTITFGEGIDTIRYLKMFDDNENLITELAYHTVSRKLSKTNFVLFKLEVETNSGDYEKLNMGLSIMDYLMTYQTIDERKIIVHFVFV